MTVIMAALVTAMGACFFSLTKKSGDDICITEVCTHNEKAAHDEYGDYGSDYIEIYNPTKRTINLLGYGLSDDSSKLSKFLFPDIDIEPGEAMLLWSSEDKYPPEVWKEDYVPSDIHGLGFNISDGEVCILTGPDGKVISAAIVPYYLKKDTTISAAKADLKTFEVTEPSPYFVMDEIVTTEEKELIDPPVFSVEGGWFEDEVTLELTSSSGDIYYTLDGSIPDENSFLYEGPITMINRSDEDNYYLCMEDTAAENSYIPEFNVDKATVVKAIAISETGKSDVASNTFFVGLNEEDYEKLPIMAISFAPEDFYDYESGIHRIGSVARTFWGKIDGEKVHVHGEVANYGMKGKSWERDATIEFFTAERDKVLKQDVGIRIHGGYSVNLNQKSFNLYAREEYDGSEFFNYDFLKNGNSYNKLVLRNGGSEDTYLSKMRDVFNQDLGRGRAVGTQDSVPCVVFLNGEYWGLYNLQEKACDNYVWNHYGVSEEDVTVIKLKRGEYVPADDEDSVYAKEYADLVDFVINSDMSDEDDYRYVESRIDIQSLIDCYVLKIYTGCVDAYYHNECLWKAKTIGGGPYNDGKWRFLANDLDNTDYLNDGNNNPDIDSFIEGNWYTEKGPLNDGGLLASLMANEEFKERFVTSFMDMMNNNFRYEDIVDKLWSDAGVIANQNVMSQLVFRGTYENDFYPSDEIEYPYDELDFGFDVGLIDVYFRERPEYMKEYIRRDLDLTGSLYDLHVVGKLPEGANLVINTSKITDFSGYWSGSYFGDYPVTLSIEAESDGQEPEFSGWFINGELVSADASYEIPTGFSGDMLEVEIRP